MSQIATGAAARAPELEPEQSELLRLRVLAKHRIVCIGGGNGLPVVLRGLVRRLRTLQKQEAIDLTAVVAMSDDGGSSGRLRRTRGMQPPGDVRNCLIALSGNRSPLSELFQYRFGGAKELAGHAVGNLLITALTELKGDFLEAVRMTSRLLKTRGTVLPCTTAPVELVAEMEDRTQVLGECNIRRARGKIRRVSLSPRRPPPSPGILEAIRQADLISIGPGSLYSSILPNLLVGGVAEALRETNALRVLVANLMTEPGETDEMDGAAHVRAILDHAGPVLDAVLINTARPPDSLLDRYARRGSTPVEVDRSSLLSLGVLPVEADFLHSGVRIRHHSWKVARGLINLARRGP
jgi:uncharacterized cofD-like protein